MEEGEASRRGSLWAAGVPLPQSAEALYADERRGGADGRRPWGELSQQEQAGYHEHAKADKARYKADLELAFKIGKAEAVEAAALEELQEAMATARAASATVARLQARLDDLVPEPKPEPEEAPKKTAVRPLPAGKAKPGPKPKRRSRPEPEGQDSASKSKEQPQQSKRRRKLERKLGPAPDPPIPEEPFFDPKEFLPPRDATDFGPEYTENIVKDPELFREYKVRAWNNRHGLPNAFLNAFPIPGIPQRTARFDSSEIDRIRKLVPRWRAAGFPLGRWSGFFSLGLPGRIGSTCANRRDAIQRAAGLTPGTDPAPSRPSSDYFQREMAAFWAHPLIKAWEVKMNTWIVARPPPKPKVKK